MVDLTTPEQVDAELALTADYHVTQDIDKAKRRAAALERKLDFAAESTHGKTTIRMDQKRIQEQLQQVLAYVAANFVPTDEQRLANPSVLHADFSTFHGYGNGFPSGGTLQ